MREQDFVSMGPHRSVEQLLALDKPPPPDRGVRHLKSFIGGGFQQTGLSMRQDLVLAALEELVEVVFVDTDENNLEDLPQSVKLLLNDVRAADLLEAIQSFKERFPGCEILGDLEEKWKALGASESLHSGLMTRRELGVLVLVYALWRREAEVCNFLLHGARELHQVPSNDCWKLYDIALKKHRLEIAYFFSSCGGTGSSLALLLMDLQRYLLSTDGGFTSVDFVAHVLLAGPMLHRAIDPLALKANTWALLLELMQRYKHKLDPLQLGGISVPRNRRPSTQIYLYDEHNRREQIFTSREQINEVLVEIDKLMTLGPEGQVYRARLADYHLVFPDIFSSAGCWILAYPYAVILDAFAQHSSALWIEESPLKELERKELLKTVGGRFEDFLNRYGGFRDIPELNQNEEGRPLRINLEMVKNHPRNQLAGAIEDVAQRQLEDHRDTLLGLIRQQRDRLTAAVVAEVEDLLMQPGGLELTEAFLANLLDLLSAHKETLDDQVKRARHERKQRREQLASVQHPGFWTRICLNRRGAYLKRARRAKESQLREVRQQARLELAKLLIKSTQHLQAECGSWRDGLQSLHRRLTDSLEAHWREAEKRRPICEEWIVCRDEIEGMFQAQSQEVLDQVEGSLRLSWDADEAAFLLRYRSVEPSQATRWSVLCPEGIEKHASHFARFWQGRVDRSVEEILEERGESPEQVLAYMEHRAAPLIKVDETTQIPAEKTQMVLGSETAEFWSGLVGRTGLYHAATGNRHRLSLLCAVHGINPLNGLMQSTAWKRAYDEVVASGRSPHVFPDVEIDLDLSPGDDYNLENGEVDDGSE